MEILTDDTPQDNEEESDSEEDDKDKLCENHLTSIPQQSGGLWHNRTFFHHLSLLNDFYRFLSPPPESLS